MRKHILYGISFALLAGANVNAQDSYAERVKKYIDQYYTLAIEQQRQGGIPASVTLGQGILETEAGGSELMQQANNHFGIKCKNGWTGPTFLHTDDQKDECFKKYTCAAESYQDHTDHLKRNPRYAPLFSLSRTDYAAWAVCLKKCGYATNPQYAQRLIRIIEDFDLQKYTYAALDSSAGNYPVPNNITEPAVEVATTQPKVTTEEQVLPAAMPAAKVPDTVKPAPAAVVATTVAATATVVVKDTAPAPQPAATIVVAVDTTKKPAVADTIKVARTADTDPLKSIADSARAFMTAQAPDTAIKTEPVSHDFDSSKIVSVNGLKAVMAYKDDILLQYAVKYKVRYSQLLEMNDLPDAPLPFDTYIYLQKKLTSGTHEKHTVAQGETLLMIAQSESMQLKKLASLNMLAPGEEPVAGSVLELQQETTRKPDVTAVMAAPAHATNAIVIAATEPEKNDKDYITVNHNEPVAPPVAAVKDTAQAAPAATATKQEGDDEEEEDDNTKEAKAAKSATDSIAAPGAGAAKPVTKIVTSTMPSKADGGYKPTIPAAPQGNEGERELDDLKTKLDKIAATPEHRLPVNKDDPSQNQITRPRAVDNEFNGPKSYTVKRGETAYSIAKKFNITVRDLLKWNSIEPEDLRAGQVIKIKE